MATIYIHNEYWTHETGREVLMRAAKAADGLYTPETIHIYTPEVLDYRGDEWGEVDLWWSVNIPTSDSDTMRDTLYAIVDSIRDEGIRVKDAGIMSDEYARCNFDTLIVALYPTVSPDLANGADV